MTKRVTSWKCRKYWGTMGEKSKPCGCFTPTRMKRCCFCGWPRKKAPHEKKARP